MHAAVAYLTGTAGGRSQQTDATTQKREDTSQFYACSYGSIIAHAFHVPPFTCITRLVYLHGAIQPMAICLCLLVAFPLEVFELSGPNDTHDSLVAFQK